jgi:hypothetical protein
VQKKASAKDRAAMVVYWGSGLPWGMQADILRPERTLEVSMRKFYVPVMFRALLVVGAFAQSDSDYQGWMKTIGPTLGSLNKKIAAKVPSLVCRGVSDQA